MRVITGLILLPFIGWIAVAAAEAAQQASSNSLFTSCAACHGNHAQGNDALQAPALAGQHAWYLVRQLNHYKNNVRGAHPEDAAGQQMAAISAQLSEADISVLSDFLQGLDVGETPPEGQGDLMNGSRYYQAKCGACHGGQAQGNGAFNAPRLNHLSVEYLHRQMDNFSRGIRGTHQDDKYGRQMAMMATVVSEAELSDIIHFITRQSGHPAK